MAVSTNAAGAPRRRRRFSILTRQDKFVLALAVGIPAFIHIFLVWIPTISSIFLSFTSWNGIGGLERIKFVGIDNYVNMFTRYPPFWPALQHNLVWLLTFLFIATPIGIFFAVLLDKNIRGTRLYQSAIYLPVVLSLAIVGFIWQLQYAPEEGVLNNVIHNFFPNAGTISWLGDKNINLAAVLVAASWRHIGYIMVLYLAGLKSVDPSLREAAAIDGASERQTFFQVVLPVLRPINVVILVITVIESLRAFDIVYVINKGQNGLELLSVLITQNIAGESSRVGFGSALAVILLLISVGPIIVFLTRTFEAPE
ncbi:MAG: carbohydrate ABC transporter permease [Chloroflexota bacterium]